MKYFTGPFTRIFYELLLISAIITDMLIIRRKRRELENKKWGNCE
jgi:hypothetical protein